MRRQMLQLIVQSREQQCKAVYVPDFSEQNQDKKFKEYTILKQYGFGDIEKDLEKPQE